MACEEQIYRWCNAADSDAWKHIDSKWPLFAGEARNIRLGLAMDGVNPFGLR